MLTASFLQFANGSRGEICSFRILEFRVVRLIPSLPAAIATTPSASRRACRMISRSDVAKVDVLSRPTGAPARGLSSAAGTLSVVPWVKISALSTIFSGSRTFPGQCRADKARIASAETISIRRFRPCASGRKTVAAADASIRTQPGWSAIEVLASPPTPLLRPTDTNAGHLQLRTSQVRANRMGGRVFPNADKPVPELFHDDTHESASAACATGPNFGLSIVLS